MSGGGWEEYGHGTQQLASQECSSTRPQRVDRIRPQYADKRRADVLRHILAQLLAAAVQVYRMERHCAFHGRDYLLRVLKLIAVVTK